MNIEKQEFQKKILEKIKLKRELQKLKEDIEQVELFGMTRDLTGKKERCKEIIARLKELEK